MKRSYTYLFIVASYLLNGLQISYAQQPDMPSMPVLPAVDVAAPPTPAPDVALPSASSASPDQTAPMEAVTEVSPAEKTEFSYGTSDVSILFMPSQIQRMKAAIQTYESINHDIEAPIFTPEIITPTAPTAKEPAIVEPDPYPVFYLSSIAYNKPGDWSIWIAGYKITSRKNDTDVSVLAVSKDSVTLSWNPTYASAIKRRKEENLFVSTDAVKNKLSQAQRISQDPSTGAVIFTLRQNQSFAVGYYSIFEGYMDSPKLEPLPVANSNLPQPMDGADGMSIDDPNANGGMPQGVPLGPDGLPMPGNAPPMPGNAPMPGIGMPR